MSLFLFICTTKISAKNGCIYWRKKFMCSTLLVRKKLKQKKTLQLCFLLTRDLNFALLLLNCSFSVATFHGKASCVHSFDPRAM